MLGEDYADIIVNYLNNPKRLEKYRNSTIQYINEAFAVVYVPVSQLNPNTVNAFGYSSMPKLFGLTSEVSLEASGVTMLRNVPALDLRGEGTLICVIDTGIDYANPLFIKSDGTSKIVSIWDQSLDTGSSPYSTGFGTEYTYEQINQALASANPLEIVPSADDNGHGTMMAGIAAGNADPAAEFSGVAPDSELVIVKLKKAKQYLRDFYLIPDNTLCFQENDIMWGVQYCLQKARDLNKPRVICLGVGSSQGAHDGRTFLAINLSIIGDFPRTAVTVSAGNEGNMGRHYFGNISPSIGYDTVELNVSEADKGFSMELWGSSPGIYSIDFLTPGGEFIPKIAASLQVNREISFIFEETIIYIDYQTVESMTGDQLILLRFKNVSPGSWRFNVYGQGNLPLNFHIWLPMGDMISNETKFIKADVYTTILAPGTAEVPITMTAYNPINRTLYTNASRGYTRSGSIKPVLAAPGINYVAPNNQKQFVNYSGTGVAAAHTAGIIAMLLEWGVVRGNQPDMDSVKIKNYLISGADRTQATSYPNRDWGYGILNIFKVFETLRADYGQR